MQKFFKNGCDHMENKFYKNYIYLLLVKASFDLRISTRFLRDCIPMDFFPMTAI
jgi:hypothetical protein